MKYLINNGCTFKFIKQKQGRQTVELVFCWVNQPIADSKKRLI